MLQHTVGYLESGCLRRLLPISSKRLKSRRTLHSGFWDHGACGLELPPLWVTLVHAAEASCRQRETDLQDIPSSVYTGAPLDFLYPTGAINFIRQYAGLGIERQDGRSSRGVPTKFGYRQYTSSAKDTAGIDQAMRVHNNEAEMQNPSCESVGPQPPAYKDKYKYGIEQRKFLLRGIEVHDRFRIALLPDLLNPTRTVDARRVTELFELLPREQRDELIYQQVIRSYLTLGDLPAALRLHKAAGELGIIAGSDELLACLLKRSAWSDAVSFWFDFQNIRKKIPHTSYNIYTVFDRLPDIASIALGLGEYVDRTIEKSGSTTPEEVPKIYHFATRILHRAMFHTDEFKLSEFSALLETLQKWGYDTPLIYEKSLEKFEQLGQTKPAIQLYRKARRMEGLKLKRSTLYAILRICCKHHSVLGMKQVLDDFFRFHKRPTRLAYRLCMAEFARQGDASTVHALFDQFIISNRTAFKQIPLTTDDFIPLLHVHAMRSEVLEVTQVFNQLQEVYGLEPDLVCWNILINAYGKVHNPDGAYNAFEKLLSQGLQPDGYTIGTMMGICAAHGDLERAIELYMLAEDMKIEKTVAIMDCLVTAHIRDEDLVQAEKICEEALKMSFEDSRTRMWNSLLVAYALRRDLVNVNRILQRMSEVKIDYDAYTYSALMQALAMSRQPDRAYKILTEVMPAAGIQATAFHYAVLLGAYLLTGGSRIALRVMNRMRRRGVMPNASSKLMAFKISTSSEEDIGEGALQQFLQMFQDMVSSLDPQEVSQTARKGAGRLPLDIAYPSMFYSYIIFVLGQLNQFETVEKLYQEFKKYLPQSASNSTPIQVLSSLMTSKLREKDYVSIKECWDLALSQAKELGRPLFPGIASLIKRGPVASKVEGNPTKGQDLVKSTSQTSNILRAHQLDLSKALSPYLESLFRQQKVDEMITVVDALLKDGFGLDHHNWNLYIQLLAQASRYKLAFELCEGKLMPNWMGWNKIRWIAPKRNRLPMEVRILRYSNPRYLRPKHSTLLFLARVYSNLRRAAAESKASQSLLAELERDCPNIIRALVEMPRTDDEMERAILRS